MKPFVLEDMEIEDIKIEDWVLSLVKVAGLGEEWMAFHIHDEYRYVATEVKEQCIRCAARVPEKVLVTLKLLQPPGTGI